MKQENKITVSAPGKLLLFGDHAVVYGYPCLVTAMDTRMYVAAEVINGDKDEIVTPQVKESKFVCESIKLFKQKFNISKKLSIKTNGDFSHRVGLGSSSAVTVALFKALSELFDKQLTKKEIFDLSYKVTLNIQKVGSGFDVAAAVYGGTIYYIKGGKNIKNIKIPRLPLVVGYSGVKADTPTIVKEVNKEYKKSESKIDSIFKSISTIVEKAYLDLKRQNYVGLGQLMIKNHDLLQKLNVSTPLLDKMVENAVNAGAYGAKLSGAGGGDCMIALVSEDKRKGVETAIEEAGGEIITVLPQAEGVRVES